MILKNKRYETISKIGEGGMGIVSLAYDRVKEKNVVIKRLHEKIEEDYDSIKRFEAEINIYKKIDSHYIAELYDVFIQNKKQYIVMEHIKGHTIKSLIKSGQTYLPEQIRDVALQILKGLSSIHKENIIHRDLTSNNVMLMDVDGNAKIIDFGISYDNDINQNKKTHEIKKFGTIDYLPPELQETKPNVKFDIYALGILMFEMIVGLTPLGYMQNNNKRYDNKAELPNIKKIDRDFPQALANIITKATYFNPDMRYNSANEMERDLRTCLDISRSLETPIELTRSEKFMKKMFSGMVGNGGKLLLFSAFLIVFGLVAIILLLIYVI